ncbi:5-formyltetrahydrofolate cyclo-ligase [Fictibacillus phosphorivorans]|uniref:5-formyltetrahydrofolate cyclo-ligase n=1 Tax=Fictibacillus phosphorivorans TaxID=1221500 RepID=A0A163R9Y4_9BACL|nr:5-formyltetrahydrofolate cyclo-ligase [Fictibacillus phosphorivorans]KZE66425.1 5-formyltetrahydrofolate cyclo-ligase [Fictibacillus phosphorivorans]
MNKSEWRKKIKQELLHTSEEDRITKSKAISNQLFDTTEWRKAQSIGITVSRKFELDTANIIKRAWEEGKKVGVPKCYSADKQMEFREIRSYEQLENVYMDLYEPKKDETPLIPSEQIDLIIVPGLVFDKTGYRIGYGGGYYDRYLYAYSGQKISLAYTFQTTDKLPHEEFDIPVDQIITEDGRFI